MICRNILHSFAFLPHYFVSMFHVPLYVDVKNGSIYVNWAETGNSIVGNLLGSFGGVKYTPGK